MHVAGCAEPLDGGDLVPRRRSTASIRQDRIGRPSTSTVQAPHTPCSHPTCVPVSRRSCRRKSDSSRRAGTDAGRQHPVDVQHHVVQRLRLGSSCSSPPSRPPRAARARSGPRPGGAGSRRSRGCRARGPPGPGRAGRPPPSRRRRPPARATASVRSSTTASGRPRCTPRAPRRSCRRRSQRHDRGEPAHGVVAVPSGDLDERRAASAAAAAGSAPTQPAPPPRPPTPAARGRTPRRAIVRVEPCRATSTVPPVRARTAVISPLGSAWARLPTVVPRLRITGCATSRSACRSRGSASTAAVVPLHVGVPGQRADAHPSVSTARTRGRGCG